MLIVLLLIVEILKPKRDWKHLKDPYSAFRCRTIMNCADVCPKGLNPAEAIAKIRREMLHHTE